MWAGSYCHNVNAMGTAVEESILGHVERLGTLKFIHK